MTVSFDSEEKPLIGFFPPCYSLAETGRLVMIAKRYRELGGKTIFFSHGGQYEYLIKENGFNLMRINPIQSEEENQELLEARSVNNIIQAIKYLKFVKSIIAKNNIEEGTQHEIEAYKQTGIKMLVCAFIFTCSISTRATNIPYISIIPEAGSFYIRVPDFFENIFTRLFPQSLKIRFLNWCLPRTKILIKPFNNVAKKLNVTPFRYFIDLFLGDFTFVTDTIEFINIFPNQQRFPTENYIGPILLDELFVKKYSIEETKQIESEINSHLNKKERSLFINLGSIGHKKLFLKIIKILNETNYNVIALYNQPLKKDELANLGSKILVKKFIPSIEKVHKMVDLSIIHGGQGTVYAAAYSGKPIIGFPTQGEQFRNIEKFIGHGSGLILSIKYFSKERFLAAIYKIFNNYDTYLTNAQILAKKLPPPQGDKNAVRRIIEIQNINKKL